jgi:hypothetical protein
VVVIAVPTNTLLPMATSLNAERLARVLIETMLTLPPWT